MIPQYTFNQSLFHKKIKVFDARKVYNTYENTFIYTTPFDDSLLKPQE